MAPPGSAGSIWEFIALRPRPSEPVVLLGCGPSLDLYEPDRHSGQYVIAMNEVAEHRACDAALFLDVQCSNLSLRQGLDIFRLQVCRFSHNGRGWYFPTNLGPGTPAWPGSLGASLWLCHRWGAPRIVVYGCDSVGGKDSMAQTAAGIKFRLKRPELGAQQNIYRRNAEAAVSAVERFGMDVDWVHLRT